MATEDISVALGKRIRRFREQRGWHQEDLAAQSGLNRVAISRLECGKQEAKLKTLQALAGSFGMTVSQLLKGL
jgi:XRE family transcriptional regulator, regulator of sulfur utilization